MFPLGFGSFILCIGVPIAQFPSFFSLSFLFSSPLGFVYISQPWFASVGRVAPQQLPRVDRRVPPIIITIIAVVIITPLRALPFHTSSAPQLPHSFPRIALFVITQASALFRSLRVPSLRRAFCFFRPTYHLFSQST